ncbi:MAG TPA: hypothetical protein VJ823_07930 [Rhodanobacteraceae bacterium]|nr:hypothetical protein [Rhodanobacteraceae bacterium]
MGEKMPGFAQTHSPQPTQRVLKNLNIAPKTRIGEAARLGEDVLAAYSEVVFDFNPMTFPLAARRAPQEREFAHQVTRA